MLWVTSRSREWWSVLSAQMAGGLIRTPPEGARAAGQRRGRGPSGLKVSSGLLSHLSGEALHQHGTEMSGSPWKAVVCFPVVWRWAGCLTQGHRQGWKHVFLNNRLLSLGPSPVGLGPQPRCLLVARLCVVSVRGERLSWRQGLLWRVFGDCPVLLGLPGW